MRLANVRRHCAKDDGAKLRALLNPAHPPRGTQKPPRVLAVGPLPPPINGLSKAFGFVSQGLGSLGWDVETVDVADRSPPRAGSSFSWQRASEVARVLGRGFSHAPFADLVYVTISQSRLGFAKDLLLLQWATALGRPVVVHMHGGNFAGFFAGLSRPEQALVRATLARLSAIVVLTESLRADFRMSPRWESQTVAVSNTCDTLAGRPRLHPGKRWSILFLSNLLIAKGYRETILAVGELGRRRPELTLSLEVAGAAVPEGAFPDAQAQEANLRELLGDLPSNVTGTFSGVLTGEQKNQRLAAADVFILPTDYVNEGQPIAIIEALCAGLPVIATDWRGIKETLPEGMHPLLVPRREVETLVDRLCLLIDDAPMFEAVSREALQQADRFTPARHLAALDVVFRQALAEAGKGVPPNLG